MVYNYNEIIAILKSDYNLNKKLTNEELFKLDKGIYSDKKVVDPMIIYAKKYPNSVITLDNAFYYYGLTDVIPNKYHLATKQKSKPIIDEKVIQIFSTDELLDVGKTQINIDGNLVNMYDKERLLIELIRRKNQTSLDYYKEIINNYRNEIYKLDIQKIEEYASKFNANERILETIQMEVL